jgi:uncharacterized protein (TIGR02217 family)
VTLPSFPTLPGIGWSVHKRPNFSTRVQSHVSGRDVRVANYAHALYEFEVQYDGLDSAGKRPGLTANSLQTLMGFFLSCQGQLNTFLYTDPTDNSVTAQTFATGDGTTTAFTLGRTIGSYFEPVSYVVSVTQVTVNGTPTGAYTLTAPNTITFTSAPANAAVLNWTGTYAFQCRFTSDTIDFENILYGLWTANKIIFRQVR